MKNNSNNYKTYLYEGKIFVTKGIISAFNPSFDDGSRLKRKKKCIYIYIYLLYGLF